MKKCFIFLFIALMTVTATMAQSHRYQRGYTRKSTGTYVTGHYKTRSDRTNHNNFSTRGVRNPYTGSKGYRAKDLEDSLEWLIDAGLIFKVPLVEKPNIPLSSYADNSYFKIYLCDVGLMIKMANIKSAKKRIKVIDKKTARNKRVKDHVKQAIREFDDAMVAEDMTAAGEKLVAAEKKLKQAASKGSINKFAASRKVSRLTKRFNAAKAAK